MKPVSVIIPAFDGERFLGATIESVLAQETAPLEILVCDDGSTDDTPRILASFGERVRVLRQENAGVSAARNRAAGEARGDVLAFLDQDDLWEPQMLTEQTRLLEREPGCGLVYADSWVIDEHGRTRGRRGAHLRFAAGRVFEALLDGNFVPIETMLIRTTLFRELDGFRTDLRLLEDYELCLRAARRTSFARSPEPLGRYRVHASNLTWNHGEDILREYAQILGEILGSTELTDDEREHAARALRDRFGELAWYALRRGDLAAADAWLDRLDGPCRPGLARKVRLLRGALRVAPRAVSRALLALLPRRRIYGV